MGVVTTQLAILVGLPAAGKTTFARQHGVDWVVLEADAFAPDYRGFWEMVEAVAAKRRDYPRASNSRVMLDGTFHRRRARERAVGLFKPYVRAIAYVFDTGLDECLQRNARRRKVYPESEVFRKANSYEGVALAEGFEEIYRVRAANGDFVVELVLGR